MAYLRLIYVIELRTDTSEVIECRNFDAFNPLKARSINQAGESTVTLAVPKVHMIPIASVYSFDTFSNMGMQLGFLFHIRTGTRP